MGVMEILEDGTIYIEAVQKMIGKESESAERVRIHRERKKTKLLQCNTSNVTGNPILEEEKEEEKESKHSDEIIELTQYFYTMLLTHVNPPSLKNKNPDFQKWQSDFDKIVRIDKQPIADIKKVIDWVVKDNFWKSNILSPDKLRKQYDKLFIQCNNKKKNSKEWGDFPKDYGLKEGEV
jgi:hypothetical protein